MCAYCCHGNTVCDGTFLIAEHVFIASSSPEGSTAGQCVAASLGFLEENDTNRHKYSLTLGDSQCWHTHHSDGIVEEAFAKHHDVELLVDRHILKHAQHGHGVHSRDDAGEQQVLLEVDVLHAKRLNLADGKQRHADADAVPQGPHHGEPQHLQADMEDPSDVVCLHVSVTMCFRRRWLLCDRPCQCSQRKAWWA